jgi:organic hydroperoxide reductase OsmC/OhrA
VEEKTMKLSKKLEYELDLIWDKRSGSHVNIRGFPKMKLDMPTEFGGMSSAPCPDELFFTAIGGCILTTFIYFKERLNLNLKELRVSIQGTVEYSGPKGYRVSEITIVVNVEVPIDDKAKAEECTELAINYCHLTRSLEEGIPLKISSKIQLRS